MYDHIREDILFIILYSGVLFMAMIASCYLLLRRGNAFAPGITPPARLRQWTGVFIASIALNHVWYMPILFATSHDDILMTELIGGMLDNLTVFPLSIVVLLAMLQDRRRPLWPIAVMTAPIALGMAVCVVRRSSTLYPVMYVYVASLIVALIIYMVREVRHYGRWLRDNYADLEHKEVWSSFVVLVITLLVFFFYESSDEGPTYPYIMQTICVVLIGYLLWRVETLSDLSEIATRKEEREAEEEAPRESRIYGNSENIESSLKQYCEEPQLYLQHDISVTELAKQIGTNRSYLSKYFAQQGVTYNAYINGLRIRHFVKLYQETTASHQSTSTKQLAFQSGFRSYSTFNAAFKLNMGMTAGEWMRIAEELEPACAGQQCTTES
jgi:AraC-like DNA-binding protein